jgi:O-antigen/teichoic acid export membrane protein
MSKFKKIATLGFGSGINILVNFLFLPILTKYLSQEDYGILSVFEEQRENQTSYQNDCNLKL